MVVGAVAAAAVIAVAVVAAAPSGGTSTALIAAAPEIGAAAAGGAATGAGGKKGKTFTEETMQITQKITTLNFNNNLNIQSASDTTITASNLKADNATILAGKFRDGGIDTITNSDAKLTLNSAFDTSKTETTTTRVKPNYVGIAVVSGVSTYVGYKLTTPVGPLGPQIPIISSSIATAIGAPYTGYSLNSNIDPDQKSFMDPLYNIRNKSSSSNYEQKEIETNFHFNNLITQ